MINLNGFYVYFYQINDQIKYIGKTKRIEKRHQEHLKEDNFSQYTHIYLIELPNAIDMEIYEKYCISKFLPEWNILDTNKGNSQIELILPNGILYSKQEFEQELIHAKMQKTKNNLDIPIIQNIPVKTIPTLQNNLTNINFNPQIILDYYPKLTFTDIRWLLCSIDAINQPNRNIISYVQFFNYTKGGYYYISLKNSLQKLKELFLLDENNIPNNQLFFPKDQLISFDLNFLKQIETHKAFFLLLFLIEQAKRNNNNEILYDDIKLITNYTHVSNLNSRIISPAINDIRKYYNYKINFQIIKESKNYKKIIFDIF